MSDPKLIGELSNQFMQWLKENPEYLTDYVNDLFVSDRRRFKNAAEENDEETTFLVGLRRLGSHTFKVHGSLNEHRSMGEARLYGELDGNYKPSQWFRVTVKPRDEDHTGTQIYGVVEVLSGPEEAKSIAVDEPIPAAPA